jgi:5'-phosphate synthase pdxT subunit
LKIGVLAVQGDFAEHISVLRRLDVDCYEVRLPEHLEGMDGLIIPGGESTTLSRLMSIYHLREPVRAMAERGKAIWGTCAGMIVISKRLTDHRPSPLGLMDIEVSRNAFGSQVHSFEADLEMGDISGPAFRAVFIRAPVVNKVGEGVRVLAQISDGRPVAVRQDRLLATSFHPELTDDTRVHELFVRMVEGSA